MHLMKNEMESLCTDESFLKNLNVAIDSGKGIDYGYNPDTLEDMAWDTFEVNVAREAIIKVLKKYLLKKST